MNPSKHSSRWPRPLLALGLLLNALTAGAGPAHLTPLLQGKWPPHAGGPASDVKVVGTRAYVTALSAGLIILDVSNPASPVRLGGYDTSGYASGLAVAGNRVYVADGSEGLKVFCTLPNVQQMVRVDDGTLGSSFTIEAAADLNGPIQWLPIFTTNPTALPFEFTDFDVRISVYPQKFYRVRQP